MMGGFAGTSQGLGSHRVAPVAKQWHRSAPRSTLIALFQ